MQSIFYKNSKKKNYSDENMNHEIHIDISLKIVYICKEN